jgi:hypothetical protein
MNRHGRLNSVARPFSAGVADWLNDAPAGMCRRSGSMYVIRSRRRRSLFRAGPAEYFRPERRLAVRTVSTRLSSVWLDEARLGVTYAKSQN